MREHTQDGHMISTQSIHMNNNAGFEITQSISHSSSCNQVGLMRMNRIMLSLRSGLVKPRLIAEQQLCLLSVAELQMNETLHLSEKYMQVGVILFQPKCFTIDR